MPIKVSKFVNNPNDFGTKHKILLMVALCFFSINSVAQCAMCRASLESEGNKVKAEAVNDGIVLLMAVPYILFAIIGFVVYRIFYNKK